MTIDRNHLVVGLFLLLLAASTGAYAMWGNGGHPPYDPRTMTASSTPDAEGDATSTPANAPGASDHGYGNAILKLNEVASFPDGLSIRPTAVLEDSRCPTDVQCIQAGTVRISVRIGSANGTSAREFKIGTTVTTEAQTITLTDVGPVKHANSTLTPGDYRFTFKVTKRAVATPPPQTTEPKQCYVGGCSAQLCTDSPNAISTCEYRAEYACYRTAKCERQASGQCGWTQTAELSSCLANPPQSQTTQSSSEPKTVPGDAAKVY